jgi:nucleotide-binding universal stress UspA family protein
VADGSIIVTREHRSVLNWLWILLRNSQLAPRCQHNTLCLPYSTSAPAADSHYTGELRHTCATLVPWLTDFAGVRKAIRKLTGSGTAGANVRRLQCIQEIGRKNHRRPCGGWPQPFKNINAERRKGAILSAFKNQTATKLAKSALTLRNVLFATDFSAACNNAWWYAVSVAKHYHSKLFVVHVISPLVYRSVPPQLLAEAQKQTRLEATAQMARLQRRQGGTTGLESEAVLREGDVADTLLRLVSEYNIDLLVVATRGYRHLKRLLLGSVAEKLFRQAFCPVLVVPLQARRSSDRALGIRRIVCPIDFSPASSAALAFAILLARDYEAQLILVHVVEGAVINSVEDMHQLREPAEGRLRQLLPARHDLAFEPLLEVAFGAPTEGISRIAAEYQSDLVVVGVHSAGPRQAHEYERTAYRIIRWSQCPVATILDSTRKEAISAGEQNAESA